MNFKDEKKAITDLTQTIILASATLYNTTKYLYAAADSGFYKIQAKDVLRGAFTNITDPTSLLLMGIRPDEQNCTAMKTPEYERVLSMIIYSIAVRLPIFKEMKVGKEQFTDSELKLLYKSLLSSGAQNHDDFIEETYDENKKLLRADKITPYTSDWYKAYLLHSVPHFTEITNKNLYLFGASDMLFSLFWTYLEDAVEKTAEKHIV